MPTIRSRPAILIVDDDEGIRFTLSEVLAETGVNVLQAAHGQEALKLLEKHELDLIITDLRMPEMDGLELLQIVKQRYPNIRVVVITAHGSESHAVQAMKLGAYDYFAKPFNIDDIIAVVQRATEAIRLSLENRQLKAQLALSRHMIFRSDAMLRVAEIVDRVANRDVTVLIQGESGTGKELIADALVAASHRADHPFLKFNCAAMPRDLAETELFGHAQGAFTGATKSRLGLFRKADKGTLFLDEVAELDMVIQSKLLRVLQSGEVKVVGEDQIKKIDVRLIAATHRNLEQEVTQGRFRADLFYRLHVVVIQVPPLKERPEDISFLIDYFLHKYAERFGVTGCQLTSEARLHLQSRDYPGNVRELENMIESMVALSHEGIINKEKLEPRRCGEDAVLGLKERVEAFERGLILQELQHSGGNRSEAARRLKIGRVTLLDKLRKYGL